MSSSHLVAVLFGTSEAKIHTAGGAAAWDALPAAEQAARNVQVFEQLCAGLGSEAYAVLPPEEKTEINLFIWAGCGMHKEMNSVKGGNKSMAGWWAIMGLTPPIKLMNRDNAAAAAAGTSDAQAHAAEVSDGGGVKATSLAGAIFHHKDNKKGQQDTLRIFLESTIGFMVHFPDMSNTRCQSHCEAAAELLVHLDLYLQFLNLVQNKKDNGSFNHMESNVYKALQDIPTLTELAVLTLYSQSISHPYMCKIRESPIGTLNTLDLGPFHEDVKAHCRSIISNPDLLLSPDASYKTATLNHAPWQRPEAFYAVHQLLPRFPHLRGALVAFFEGALETWERFTSEFAPDGRIAQASSSACSQAFLLPTNDANEGALGLFQVDARHSPNKSLATFNAEAMYKRNGTAQWMRETLGPEDHCFLRKHIRETDEAGLAHQAREEQAAHDKATAAKREAFEKARDEKAAAVNAELDRLELKLNESWWAENSKKTTVPQIEMQLAWLRREEFRRLKKGEVPMIPKKSHLKNKSEKFAALIEALKYYNAHVEAYDDANAPSASNSLITDVDVEMEADSDSDDSELYH